MQKQLPPPSQALQTIPSSGISQERFLKAYQKAKSLYPFREKYLGQKNPYTGKQIQSETDYQEYLRAHTSFLLSASDLHALEEKTSSLESENTALQSSAGMYRQSWQDSCAAHTKTRKRFRALIAVLFVAFFVFTLLYSGRVSKSASASGYQTGYSDGSASGYQTGYGEGQDAGYSLGLDEGYQNGYSDGEDAGYSEGYGKGKSDGFHSSIAAESNAHSSGSGASSTSATAYIGNLNTHKFHRSTCSYLPAESNRTYFSTAEEAEVAGYTPCSHGHP